MAVIHFWNLFIPRSTSYKNNNSTFLPVYVSQVKCASWQENVWILSVGAYEETPRISSFCASFCQSFLSKSECMHSTLYCERLYLSYEKAIHNFIIFDFSCYYVLTTCNFMRDVEYIRTQSYFFAHSWWFQEPIYEH